MNYDIALCEGGKCPRRTFCYRAQLPLIGRYDMFGTPPFTKDGGCDYFWPYTRLRIGMQGCLGDPGIWDIFQNAVAQGLDVFELCCSDCLHFAGRDNHEDFLPPDAWVRIRSHAQSGDIELAVRTAIGKVLLPGQIDRHCDYAIQLAQAIGASILVVPIDLENGENCFIQRLAPLMQEIQHFSCLLALENSPHDSPTTIRQLFSTLWSDFPQWRTLTGLCFDMGHANLCPETNNDYHAFLDALADQVPIIHLHLHENWGDRDSHLPLFAGSNAQDISGLRGIFQRLGKQPFTGSAVMCHRPGDVAKTEDARTLLTQMLRYSERWWTTASELRQGCRR